MPLKCKICKRRRETENRQIESNNNVANKKYGDNRVINSKYTWWSFLPLILWAHIRRFMNLYFILIGCLQLWSDVAPVNPLTTWIPIIVIFAIAFVREGIDDYHKHQQDNEVNNRKFHVIRDGAEMTLPSHRIMCGDLIIVSKDEEVPCDVACAWTSDPRGICCIETANLNGETALKERKAMASSQALGENGLITQKLCLVCGPPDPDVYEFSGFVKIGGWGAEGERVERENFIPAGTHIKNTEKIIGLACYTGRTTKLGLNAKPPPVKWTQIERFVDKCTFVIFLTQVIIAIVFGAIGNWMRSKQKGGSWYLRLDLGESLPEETAWVILYVRVYLLTSVMIPISLKVTIDVLKYIYAIWIRSDAQMYTPERRDGALVNNTSVIEDLGAIEYVFSDKTGTMTENEMRLLKLAARERLYGHSEQADDVYEDPAIKEVLEREENDEERVWLLMLLWNLSVCHTVKVLTNEDTNKKSFEGISAEEVAFLEGLANVGVQYEQDEGVISFENAEMGLAKTRFKIHVVIPFREDRKRMGVVAENLDTGRFYLFSKGAHETILTLTGAENSYPEFETQAELLTARGLRVMAMSFKEVSEKDTEELQARVRATTEIMDKEERNRKLEEAYEAIERDQIMIGLAGIEDKLQDGVPQTIEILREAGIRVWMVTGDAPNTAVKIARTTRLLGSDGRLIDMTPKDETGIPRYSSDYILNGVSAWIDAHAGEVFYLLVDGTSHLTQDYLGCEQERFRKIASRAKCVICARTAPKQKAKYVECIKALKKITLAIGDGGNDVTMINTSHIGVGIMGKEGRQAASASDMAIHKFRYLQRLLLVHGRYSAYRTSWLVQFCFYKSIMLVIVQICYLFWNGFSAISFIGDFNLMCYNAVFTLLPVIFFLLDKDIEDITLFLHPYVYSDTRRHTFCNIRTMFWWVVRAIFHGIVIVIVVNGTCTKDNIAHFDGGPICTDEAQQITYSILIMNVLITTSFDTRHFTSLNIIFIWGNWILYVLFASLANMIPMISITREIYHAVWRSFSSPLHWMIVLTGTAICILPVILIQSLFAIHLPTRTQELRSIEIERRAEFKPVYEVDLRKCDEDYRGDCIYLEQDHPPTVWDKSHNIFTPLLALCGC